MSHIYGYSALEQMRMEEERRNGVIIVICGLAVFITPILGVAVWAMVA